MAKDLKCILKSRKKVQEPAKRNLNTSGIGVQQRGLKKAASKKSSLDAIVKQQGLKKAGSKKSSLDAIVMAAKKSVQSLDEKQMLKKEVIGFLMGRMTEKLLHVLKKFNFVGLKDGEIDVDISAFDVVALWELKSMFKGSSVKATPAKTTQMNVERPIPEKVVHKGVCASVNGKPPVRSTSSSLSTGSTRNRFGHGTSNALSSSDGPQTSNTPSSSSKDSLKDLCQETKTDSEVKIASTDASTFGLDSDVVPGSVLDEENTCTSPNVSPVTSVVSGESLTSLCDHQQSMNRALRAAMLKTRFAEIIAKANGDKFDPRKMQHEREILQRLQQEEEAKIKARLETNIKAQREAARILLEKMERTVYIDDNLPALWEFEAILNGDREEKAKIYSQRKADRIDLC